MKLTRAARSLVGFALLSGCTQVDFTRSTFLPKAEVSPPTSENSYRIVYHEGEYLVLEISRKVTNYGHALDEYENQLLVLQIRDIKLNERLAIPSTNVTPHFVVTRFGPTSLGQSYHGFLIIKNIADDEINAYLRLDVTANTRWDTPPEKIRFRGNYVFVPHRERPETN